MERLLALSLLMVTGCGMHSEEQHAQDSQISIIVSQVEQDLESRGVQAHKVWGSDWSFDDNLPDYEVSECNGELKISVSRAWWNRTTSNIYLKKMLLAHEFGHCVWNLSHEAVGIMTPNLNDITTQVGYDNLMDNFAEELRSIDHSKSR